MYLNKKCNMLTLNGSFYTGAHVPKRSTCEHVINSHSRRDRGSYFRIYRKQKRKGKVSQKIILRTVALSSFWVGLKDLENIFVCVKYEWKLALQTEKNHTQNQPTNQRKQTSEQAAQTLILTVKEKDDLSGPEPAILLSVSVCMRMCVCVRVCVCVQACMGVFASVRYSWFGTMDHQSE